MSGPMVLLFITFLGAISADGSPIAPPKCNDVCTDIFSPVCGSDGNEYRMFVSECEMNSYNCYEQKEFYAVKSDLCNDEDLDSPRDCGVCPEIWAPVCGSDGFETRTFASECFLEAINCVENRSFTAMKSGKCDGVEIWENVKKPCRVCTRIYDPVCGSDGTELRSFPNECEMESVNCRESRNFHLTKEGAC